MTALRNGSSKHHVIREFATVTELCDELERLRKQGVVEYFIESTVAHQWMLTYVEPKEQHS